MAGEVRVAYEVDDELVSPADLEDEYLSELLLHTGDHARQTAVRQIAAVRCPEHGQAPVVIITVHCARQSDQMELNYHVESCCNLLLLRTVQALNH